MIAKTVAGCMGLVAAPRRPAGGGSLPALRTLLSVPGILRLSAGNGLAQSGLRLQSFVLAWLVLELTGSKMTMGVVLGLPALAVVGASLAGGVLADSSHARMALKWTRLVMAAVTLTTGLLVTTGQVEIGFLVVAMVVVSVATAIDMPVNRTMIFELVGRERALSGTALSSMAMNLSTMVGPMLLGLLMVRFGVDVALFAIAGGYLVAATLVPAVTRQAVMKPDLGPVHEIRAGLAYLRETPCVAWLISLFFLVPVAGIFFAMVPVYAHEILAVGPAGLGALMGAYGAGTVVGSAYLVVNGQLRQRGLRVTAVGVLFGVAVTAFAMSPTFLLSLLIAFAIGVTAMLWLNTLTAMVQVAAAPEMKGRAMSVGTMGTQLMSVGWFVAGGMSTLAGPIATVVFSGVAFAVMSLVVFSRSADVRNID